MYTDLAQFPQRTVNGFKLDLFGLYHNVCARGGFPVETNGSAAKVPWSWSKEIFKGMANYTDTHRCTSVGHDLIQSYRKYLLSYELAHPEDVNKSGEVPAEIPRGERQVRVRMPSAAGSGSRRRRTPSEGGEGGRGRGRGRPPGGRGRPRSSAGPRSLPPRGGNNFNFSVGNRLRVYWPSDAAWYSGMVVMQETTPEGVVYSKIDYDDGDEEVLNLANEICECLDVDDDGLVYRPRPSARRSGMGQPGQLALEYQGGHEHEQIRQPISMEEVLEAMNRREAARGLYELCAEPHEPQETFRLGYMMGVRRSANKAVEIMQTMLARAFPEGDPMRDLVTKDDLHTAVVDGTYEADAESDLEDVEEDAVEEPQRVREHDAPWPKDENVPSEEDVKKELEQMRIRAQGTVDISQAGDAEGKNKLVVKVKRGREDEGIDDEEDQDAKRIAPEATTAGTLGDQRRIALNKVVNVEYGGDKVVLRWLDTHGWGQYAGNFAHYGVTRRTLNHLNMTDLENLYIDTEHKSAMAKAIDRRRKRNEKYRLHGT
jgi:hypothetical protein